MIHVLKGEPVSETHIVGLVLEADQNTFQQKDLEVDKNRIKVTIPSLEGCLILKLWSVEIESRPQDVIDVLNIILRHFEGTDFPTFGRKVYAVKLLELPVVLKKKIESLAGWLKEGRLDALWEDYQGRRLLDREKNLITSALKRLDEYLRRR